MPLRHCVQKKHWVIEVKILLFDIGNRNGCLFNAGIRFQLNKHLQPIVNPSEISSSPCLDDVEVCDKMKVVEVRCPRYVFIDARYLQVDLVVYPDNSSD